MYKIEGVGEEIIDKHHSEKAFELVYTDPIHVDGLSKLTHDPR